MRANIVRLLDRRRPQRYWRMMAEGDSPKKRPLVVRVRLALANLVEWLFSFFLRQP